MNEPVIDTLDHISTAQEIQALKKSEDESRWLLRGVLVGGAILTALSIFIVIQLFNASRTRARIETTLASASITIQQQAQDNIKLREQIEALGEVPVVAAPTPEVIAGEPGAQGQQGPIGPIGIEGPQGPKGDKGDKGDPGSIGLPGTNGIDGAKGDQGAPGTGGSPGAKGDPGDPGTQGVQGDPGVQGTQGPQGVQGDPGPQGVQGDPGVQGGQGVQGIPGTVEGLTLSIIDNNGVLQSCVVISGVCNFEPVPLGRA